MGSEMCIRDSHKGGQDTQVGRSHRWAGHTGGQATQPGGSHRGQITQVGRLYRVASYRWTGHTVEQVTEGRSHR